MKGVMLDLNNDETPALSGTSNLPCLICAQISTEVSLNGLRSTDPPFLTGKGRKQTAWKITTQKQRASFELW